MESAATDKQPSSGNNLWKQLIAFALGAALLYFSFRGCDFASIWGYAQKTKPIFLILMCVSCLLSHVPRAQRWVYLLEPIEHRKVSLWNSFCAVILGYAVNIPIPRGGEVARLVSISRSEKLPWAGVLPTMLIDRMLDMVMLGLLFGVTLTSLPESLKTREVVVGGFAVTACSVAGLIALPFIGKILHIFLANELVSKRLPQNLSTKLSELAGQFEIGTKSLTDIRYIPKIAILTGVIWFLYWLNLYLAVLAFDLQNQVSPMQTLLVFTMGTLGVLLPAPGSVGTYHLMVKTALMAVSGLNENLALAYVSVLHLLCFIIVPCVTAAVCISIQSAGLKKQSS